MTETFYIQDPTGSEGFAVYRSCHDGATSALPNVGDIVTVSGYLADFDSSLQISSSAANMIAETITITGSGGMATSGAYPPAGMPIDVAMADQAGYAHDVPGLNPHPEQVGMALHFAGVTVANRYPLGFTSTSSDGGIITEGFQLSNGVWVDDTYVYHDCIKPLGDAGITSLPNGIKGMWDRYQDYYGYNPDGGYSPTVPVLIPMTCADLQEWSTQSRSSRTSRRPRVATRVFSRFAGCACATGASMARPHLCTASTWSIDPASTRSRCSSFAEHRAGSSKRCCA